MPVNVAQKWSSRARRGLVLMLLASVVPSGGLSSASADDSEPVVFEPPPDPRHRPPALAGQVHLDFALPLVSGPLCPRGAACIFGRSAGLGAIVERRWQSGLALGLTYSAWFMDGNGVYEISVLQALGVSLRVILLRERLVHPFFGGSGGAVLFGDTFRVATSGLFLEGVVGVEVELSEDVAFTFGLKVRSFATRRFTTADDVLRAAGNGVNLSLAAQIGLVLLRR